MFSEAFLAVTGAELKNATPKQVAYMACRFSPSGVGLVNLPENLPSGSLILLDDSMQIFGHNAEIVARQLCEVAEHFAPVGVLLDFQRSVTQEAFVMAQTICKVLPCPVAVSENYARDLDCAVFLSACPANVPLEKYLQPWKHGVYLEIAPGRLQIAVTEAGAEKIYLPVGETGSLQFQDTELCCHYKTEVSQNRAVFTLQRNKEDLEMLIEKARDLGVVATVGLYQELADLQ